MLARRQAPTYDVCIIGSGAGGGMAAYALTQAGAQALFLVPRGPDPLGQMRRFLDEVASQA